MNTIDVKLYLDGNKYVTLHNINREDFVKIQKEIEKGYPFTISDGTAAISLPITHIEIVDSLTQMVE